ncbi:hypothetical protein ACA910_006014 [Epithemia clementina (nom. ined.)]
MLGAPVLLYRNVESYTPLDIIPPVLTPHTVRSQSVTLDRRLRAQARWYYPIDQHLYETAGVTEQLDEAAVAKRPTQQERYRSNIEYILKKYAPHLWEGDASNDDDDDDDDDPNNRSNDDDGDIKQELRQAIQLLMSDDPAASYSSELDKQNLAAILSHFVEGDLEVAEKIVQELEPHATKFRSSSVHNNRPNVVAARVDSELHKPGDNAAAAAPPPVEREILYIEVEGAQQAPEYALASATLLSSQPPGPTEANEDMDEEDSGGGESDDALKNMPEARTPRRRIQYLTRRQRAILCNEDYQNQQSFHVQRNARVRILSELNYDLVATTNAKKNTHKSRFKRSVQLAKRMAQTVQQSELIYMPAKLRRQRQYFRYTLTRDQLHAARLALRQRLLCADPAYLAAPAFSSLVEASTKKFTTDHMSGPDDDRQQQGQQLGQQPERRNKKPPMTTATISQSKVPPLDVEHALSQRVGNCIACFPCFCATCQSCTDTRGDESTNNWWLLHPVGPLLDRVRLSHIRLGNHSRPFTGQRPTFDDVYQGGADTSKTEIDIGDRLWQLTKCGTCQFVARTTLQCFVLEVAQRTPKQQSKRRGNSDFAANDDSCCLGGFFYLKILCRIDCRLSATAAGVDVDCYTPRYVAAHPKYGGKWTDPQLAILMSSSRDRDSAECNVIKHVHVGQSESGGVRTSHHHITNLQDIRHIEFSKQNPMVLLAVARPFVRPTPDFDSQYDTPMIGHGYSLYTIDLRPFSNNQATFQWSPSAHEHLVEGVHSLTSVMTNWNSSSAHSVLVSSISAQKTWELDTRQPCQVVATWSLPHTCDGSGVLKAHSGVHGVGFLLSSLKLSPQSNWNRRRRAQEMFLGVNCTPGSFGVHLYRKPVVPPRLQTDVVECANWPGTKDISVSSSSCFPLPDVGDDVFTCGIDSFPALPMMLHSALPSTYPEATSTLCVVTATNKGDIYVHNLLESQDPIQQATTSNTELPVGTAALPVPSTEPRTLPLPATTTAHIVELTLCSEFPVPSSAVMKTYESTITASRRDVASFSKLFTGKGACWDHRDDPVVAVEALGPQPPFNLKIAGDQTGQDVNDNETLLIPKAMVDAAQTELFTTLDCFETTHLSKPNIGSTSDVTEDVISSLNDTWDEIE